MSGQPQASASSKGFVLFEAIFALLVLVAIGLAGYFIFHDVASSTQPSSPAKAVTSKSSPVSAPSNSYAILSPATVPPKTAECSETVTFSSNGDSGPIQCANGELNVLAWNALAALEPTVMSLGYSATPAQIQAALCKDANASDSDANTKNADIVEATVYKISALYYGWNFSSDPSSILTKGTC